MTNRLLSSHFSNVATSSKQLEPTPPSLNRKIACFQKVWVSCVCVSQDMAAVSWKVICIPYSICKNSKRDGVDVTGYDVLPCFLTMSVERLPEGLSCFCIYGRLSMPVGQRNFDQTPLTLGTFPSQTGRCPLISSWQKFKRLDLLWFGESLWTQSHSSLKGIKLIIWQNPSKIHLHISFEWVTGLLRIYPNIPAHRWNDRRARFLLKTIFITLYLEFLCARYCLSTFYRWVHFFVTLLGGKQVRPGALLRDEEAEGHHEVKQFGQAFL